MKINELALTSKAGVIPYYFNEQGNLMMMFMTPSNPAYGGNLYQIAKGRVDQGEQVQQAAFREGEEELGLNADNIANMLHVASGVIKGDDDTYILSVFAAEVKDPKAFGKPHYETGKRAWMTAKAFETKGRQNHLALVQRAMQKILAAGGQKEVS